MHQQPPSSQSPLGRALEPPRAYAANTVRALERLAFGALSTTELADSLGVSPRNARRMLRRLELEGFVDAEKQGNRRLYRATLRLAALGRQMLDHAPLTLAAAPCVVGLARGTRCAAHLWIPGYAEQVVCAVHADGRAGSPTISLLCDVGSAWSSAAGIVLLGDRARLRSSCYVHQADEATFAAAVLDGRGRVVAALGVSGDGALEASSAVVTAAEQVSADLGAPPQASTPWTAPMPFFATPSVDSAH